MVHGARNDLMFIYVLYFQYTFDAHKIQKTRNKSKFLCDNYLVVKYTLVV